MSVFAPMQGNFSSMTENEHCKSQDVASEQDIVVVQQGWQLAVKRFFDVLAASFLLLFTLPVLAIIGCLVRKDGGPVFYGHERVGQNGVPFKCYKFRSMVVDSSSALERLLATDPQARKEWEATRKLTRDPRVTLIGRLLRKTSLDEIPQLFNVLKGDMSLVGPRPVVSKELEYYGPEVRYYEAVRPGITGLWQISGRSDTTYAERVALDSQYVKKWNLKLDILILLKTLPAVLLQKGAR